MFTDLYITVFPALGKAFGFLVELATMSWARFVAIFSSGLNVLTYNNLFTGEVHTSTFYYPELVGDFISFMLQAVNPFNIEHPVWVVLLSCSVTIFLGIYLAKFVLGIFR